MKKQLLILAAALLTVAGMQARVISAGENQVWWGYFNQDDFNTADYTIGTGKAMTLMAGIYIPAGHEQLGTSTIQAVRVYLASDVVSNLSNMKIWISKTLPDKLADADYSQTTLGNPVAGINDYKLRTPYEVNGEGFYIGYSVKSTTGYFIRCGGSDAPNSFFIGNPEAGMSWSDLNGQGLGKLALQILVEGGNFPEDCAAVSDFGQNVVLQGQTASIPVTITNYGKAPINTVSYTITEEDGSTTAEESISLNSLPLNSSKTVSIPFTSGSEARKYKKTFTITQVDGKPNTATNGSANGFLITLKEKQPVTPVIEEFTGTWCGWCPRGMVGMEKVHDTYGDQVVQIAAHYSDIMAIDAYQPVINTFAGGFPSSVTDRQFEADPSFSSLKSVLNTAFNRLTQGTIELKAEWDSEKQEKVIFNTTTRFSYTDDNASYAIAYALVEDGLTGTGSSWAQQNYYNGQSGDTSMKFWYSAGSPVSGLSFDHVVVAAWSAQNGVDGTVATAFGAGEEQEYSYSGSIVNNSFVQDKTKLTAVVMLIDRATGTIVNSAKSDIADFATAIGEVSGTEATSQSEAYDLSGRKVTAGRLPQGINIVRQSDGSVRKVLVK